MTISDGSRPPRNSNVFGGFPAISMLVANAMSEYARSCARQMQDVQGEVWRFVTHRLEADSSTLQSAASCRKLGDLLEVQQQWAAQASADYAREAERMFDLAAHMGEAATGPLTTLLQSVGGETKPPRYETKASGPEV